MSKVGLIIGREYLTRVKKKSFILMTILGPILFAGFFIAIAFISKPEDKNEKVLVLDDTYVLSERFAINEKSVEWTPITSSDIQFNEAIGKFKTDEKYKDYDYLLWLSPKTIEGTDTQSSLIYRKTPSLKSESKIKEAIDKSLEFYFLNVQYKNDSVFSDRLKTAYSKIRSSVNLVSRNINDYDENGVEVKENVDFKVQVGIGLGFSFFIFFFIFFFGSQVMRGVIEEKTNRIIEVIVSSVKPFQLMMGKIIGVAFVGLTQFIIWGILSSILISLASTFIPELGSTDSIVQMSLEQNQQNADIIGLQNDLLNTIFGMPWLNIITSFLFYFLMGYLIYSALFAAIGAAVDNETDTQQFMLPITAPLIFAFYVVAFSAFDNPDSAGMFWLSMFPLTSPVVMLVRISMGSAELWEVLLSMGLLIVTFIGVVWLAGKIYRTGILMYGKKPSYKEIFKWLKY